MSTKVASSESVTEIPSGKLFRPAHYQKHRILKMGKKLKFRNTGKGYRRMFLEAECLHSQKTVWLPHTFKAVLVGK